MNTKQLNKIFTRTMYVMVIAALVFSVTGTAQADEPAPTIRISTSNNYLQADDFAPNAMVTFTVYASEGSSEVILEISSDTDEAGHAFIDGWEHTADLVAGNYVVATDNFGNEKRLVLEPLTIEVFNTATDFVAGTALPERFVWVVVGNNNIGYPADMGVYANADGIWTADFDYDLTDDMWGSAVVSDEDWDVTVYHLGPTPPAFIAVSITEHWFWVNNYVPETLVTFSIYDDYGGDLILEFSKPTDALGNLTIAGWEHIWDPEPGDYIVATDGFNAKDLVLEYVTLDVFDPVNDLVSGQALPGREVGVGVGNETGEQWINVFADDSTAEWIADFTLEGYKFDITENSWAGAHVNDEDGDVTAAHNSGPPEPPAWFTVFPEQDAVEGWDFPLGAVVHLTIDDPTTELSPDHEQDETVVFAPWGSWQLWMWFDFAGEYDVKAGDVVTLSYGEMVKTHTVQNLAVTKVDQEDDTVKGIADARAEIYVWPHATGQQQIAIANPQGKWNVDFTEFYDLMPEDGGRAEIRDELGNATAVDWYIPDPHITIYPDAQAYDSGRWRDGAPVTLTVRGKPECTLTREAWGGYIVGNFPEGCFVTTGDKVTVTDGTITRKHTVRNLAITKIDKDANTVAGVANTGADVHVWVWDTNYPDIHVTAEDGKWFADFGALGVDLVEGMCMQAEIIDENGNVTSVDLNVPDPRIVASITEDWFYIADFLPGTTLDITIYAIKNAEDHIWQSNEIMTDVNGFAWIDSEGWNLEPGNHLVVSDGNTTKDLEIEGFTFDVFNLANGQLSGTAPSGRNVWVGIGWQYQDAWTMNVTTDETTGSWIADFEKPVPSDYWWVAAQIFDDDGDASEVRPASQIIFLRPRCGDTYTVQPNIPLEIRYGSWLALGEELAIQNAEHLTVNLVLDGEPVTGIQQPVVPGSEIPCGTPREDAYGVFYAAEVGPLSSGTYVAEVTWIFDEPVTDGYDADGDGETEWYGPSDVITREFTIIVP